MERAIVAPLPHVSEPIARGVASPSFLPMAQYSRRLPLHRWALSSDKGSNHDWLSLVAAVGVENGSQGQDGVCVIEG